MSAYFSPKLRRRAAPIMLIGAVLIVGRLAQDEIPREQQVELLLGPAQRDARSISIAYTQGLEAMGGLELRYEAGAPARVTHSPSLAPGRYQVVVQLGYRDGHVESQTRSLSVPSDGAARIRLDGAPPSAGGGRAP